MAMAAAPRGKALDIGIAHQLRIRVLESDQPWVQILPLWLMQEVLS